MAEDKKTQQTHVNAGFFLLSVKPRVIMYRDGVTRYS